MDASLVPAPKQRNTDEEKEAIKAGKSAKEIWPDAPNKAAQKDLSARWTLKVGGKVRYRPDGTRLPMIAVPVFGYTAPLKRAQLTAGLLNAVETALAEVYETAPLASRSCRSPRHRKPTWKRWRAGSGATGARC